MAEESKPSRVDRLKNNPEQTEKIILNHVANGGTLIELCKDWNVPYYEFAHWMCDDPERARRYKNALNARGEWYIERVRQELTTIGFENTEAFTNEDGNLIMPTSMRDRLRAIELLGKHNSMFSDKLEVTASQDLADLVLGSMKPDAKEPST